MEIASEEYAELLERIERHLLKEGMIAWVSSLAPWEVTATFTFKWEASLASSVRCFVKYMQKNFPRVSYFYAIERNPGRGGHHIHSVWGDSRDVVRSEAWEKWFERYGRARIEAVKNAGHCSRYITKSLAAAYVTKTATENWWDVKLQFHRKVALNDGNWALE